MLVLEKHAWLIGISKYMANLNSYISFLIFPMLWTFPTLHYITLHIFYCCSLQYNALYILYTIYCRYCKDLFETDYKATIGVDFQVEIYNILGHPFTMQL